jgi:hypothetical protein
MGIGDPHTLQIATLGLAVDAAHAEVFDFEEFLDAVFRAFAADAAFLHAAEGGDLGRDDALVDADDAVFERLGNPPDAADVAAVEIGGEPCVARDAIWAVRC